MNLLQLIGYILAGASECFALYHAAVLGAALVMLPDLRHEPNWDSEFARMLAWRVAVVLGWQIIAVLTFVVALR